MPNYDMSVARTAYSVAHSMGASDKVMLALFEAGIVESGFRNLPNLGKNNDHDSVGYLQQRPSQGWPNPMDVATATRSFVNKAQPIEGKYATAGQLAQAVQRSAFPLRYDAARLEAQNLLAKVSNGDLAVTPVAFTGFAGITKVADTLTNPQWWVRIGLFVGGGVLVIVALLKMTGDNQLSTTTKKLMSVAAKVAK